MKTCPRCDTVHDQKVCPECGLELVAEEGVTPMDIFELMRGRAKTMLETALLEAGKEPPTEEMWQMIYLPVLGIGIAAATEHYAEHPEHIAWATEPICTSCREPIATLQVGVDPSRDGDTHIVKVAWPCGHHQ